MIGDVCCAGANSRKYPRTSVHGSCTQTARSCSFSKALCLCFIALLPQVRPSCFGSVTLYDYLKSLFSVWKRIPFEASLIGSAPLPHFASTTAILAPSRGIGFYWCVGCLMAGWVRNTWLRSERLDSGLQTCAFLVLKCNFPFPAAVLPHLPLLWVTQRSRLCSVVLWNSLRYSWLYFMG